MRDKPIAPRTPEHFDGTGELHKIDAVELVGMLPNDSVDLIIFDPAYESLEKYRKTGTTTRLKHSKSSSNDWFETFPNAGYFPLFGHMLRILKPGTHMYMFADEETRDMVCCGYSAHTGELIEKSVGGEKAFVGQAPARHFKFWKSLVWDKIHKGMGYHYPAMKEFILFFEKVEKKGKHRKLNTNKIGDVISIARLKGKQFYPTAKPAPLIWTLINESSNPGDVVLDMFMGGGGVPVLSKAMGRYFIGGDLSDRSMKETLEGLADPAAFIKKHTNTNKG